LQARGRGRRVRTDVEDPDVACRRGGARRERDREDDDREDEVHEDAGGEDDRLRPPRLRGERAGISGALLADREIVLAEDPHEAAERDPVERVLGLAAPDRGDARREAEGELEDLHAQEPRRGEVAELVDRDDQRERRDEQHEGLEVREDRQDARHARASAGWSSRRTRSSIRMTSSRVGAGSSPAPSSAPRRRTPAIAVKPISPARNRATASSSAAERPTMAPRSPPRAVARTCAKHG